MIVFHFLCFHLADTSATAVIGTSEVFRANPDKPGIDIGPTSAAKSYDAECRYWDKTSLSWSSEGCRLVADNVPAKQKEGGVLKVTADRAMVCKCDHTTVIYIRFEPKSHFGY